MHWCEGRLRTIHVATEYTPKEGEEKSSIVFAPLPMSQFKECHKLRQQQRPVERFRFEYAFIDKIKVKGLALIEYTTEVERLPKVLPGIRQQKRSTQGDLHADHRRERDDGSAETRAPYQQDQ